MVNKLLHDLTILHHFTTGLNLFTYSISFHVHLTYVQLLLLPNMHLPQQWLISNFMISTCMCNERFETRTRVWKEIEGLFETEKPHSVRFLFVYVCMCGGFVLCSINLHANWVFLHEGLLQEGSILCILHAMLYISL